MYEVPREDLARRLGVIWDIKAVYTTPKFRGTHFCAQRLMCKIMHEARKPGSGASGVAVTAQADTIRRDCLSRGFLPAGISFDESTMLVLDFAVGAEEAAPRAHDKQTNAQREVVQARMDAAAPAPCAPVPSPRPPRVLFWGRYADYF